MLEELIVLAENGDVNAQWKLGFKYYNGKDVEKDYTKALCQNSEKLILMKMGTL